MKLIRWGLCGSAVILACVLTRAGEPGHPPARSGANIDSQPAELVLRMYSIGDLINPAPNAPLGQGAVPPTQLMRGDLIHRKLPEALGMAANPPSLPNAATVAAALVNLIESEIGWDPRKAGSGGSIGAVGGTLVVRQTAENQRKIAGFLDQLRGQREASRALTVQADWLILGPDELSSILRPDTAGVASGEVDPVALAKLGPRAFYARGRISCMGGQTVHILSGRVRTLVENLDASVGFAVSAFQPEVEEELSGAALQVTPHLCEDRAIVDVISFVSEWNDPDDPYRMGSAGDSATTRPARANSRGPDGVASIDRLNVPAQQFCSTVRLAFGKPTVVGGMTLDPDLRGAGRRAAGVAGRQIYLVLRVDCEPRREELK